MTIVTVTVTAMSSGDSDEDKKHGRKGKKHVHKGKCIPFYQIGAEQGFLRQVVRIETGFATPLPGDGRDVESKAPDLQARKARKESKAAEKETQGK